MSQSLAEEVAMLPDDERAAFWASLSAAERVDLLHNWRFWGRPEQFAPPGDWFCWALISGRGFGKTRTGAEWVREQVEHAWATGAPIRVAIVAETAADARDVLVEGSSGLLACAHPDFRPRYQPSMRRITWPDGSYATTFSGDEPDQLRGPQHHAAWVDELAKFKYAQDCWDNLELGLRLGSHPRVVVTTTPRPIPIIRHLLSDPQTVVTSGSSYDNLANLAPTYITRIIRRYEGTRLGQQELHARLLDDVPGGLWTMNLLDATRCDRMPPLQRIAIGVDPAARVARAHERANADDNSPNETGLICAARGVDGHAYVFHDMSASLSPGNWALRVVHALREYGADRVVAEVNNGGDMVEHTLRTVDPTVPYRSVWAARNKQARAEPIAALYEQGKIHHVGHFPVLEEQMLAMTDRGYTGTGSPDRLDAAVWVLTDLMLGGTIQDLHTDAWATFHGR